MDRKQTTKLLTEILIQEKLTDRKYYAKEVTLDYGTIHSKRVDVMQFIPKGVIHASDMEKGIFVCYEVVTAAISKRNSRRKQDSRRQNFYICRRDLLSDSSSLPTKAACLPF